MIQRQLCGGKFFLTVIADTSAEKFLEVGSFAQFPGFLPFSADVGIVFIYFYPFIHWRHLSRRPARGGSL